MAEYRPEYRGKTETSPLAIFAAVLIAVWLGTTLAGITLFLGGRAYLAYEIGEAMKKVNEQKPIPPINFGPLGVPK